MSTKPRTPATEETSNANTNTSSKGEASTKAAVPPEAAIATDTQKEELGATVTSLGTETESMPPAATNPNEQPDVLAQLRVSQDFANTFGAKKVITTVPIRNPQRGVFVRVHPTMEPMLVYTIVDEQETFVVTASVAVNFPGDIIPKLLVPTISRQGILFLWPQRLPGEDGRINNWHASAREASARAIRAWVRVQANMALGAYEVFEAVGAIPEPEWPALSMDEIVRIAVRGRVIDSADHIVLKKLRGEE